MTNDDGQSVDPGGGRPKPPPFAPPSGADPGSQEPVPLQGLAIPPWVMLFAIVAGLAFVVALARLPGSIGPAVADERADRLLEAGKGEEAAKLLAPLEKRFDTNMGLKIRLARAYLMAHDLQNASDVFGECEGKEVSKDEEQELNELGDQFKSQAEQYARDHPAGEGGAKR